jgi:cobaltochelatase CobN
MRLKSMLRGDALLGVLALIVVAAFLGWVLTRPAPSLPQQVKILCLVIDSSAAPLMRAVDSLYLSEGGDIDRRVSVSVRTPANTGVDTELPDADIILVEVLDDEWLARHRAFLATSGARVKLAVGVARGGPEADPARAFGLERDERMDAYWANGSPPQLEQMLRLALVRWGGMPNLDVAPPEPRLERGLLALTPAGEAVLCADWDEWRRRQQPDPSRPVVAVLEFPTRIVRGNHIIPRAIAEELTRQGMTPAIVFGHPSSDAVTRLLVQDPARAEVACVISLAFKFADEGGDDSLRALDVPVINAITVYGRTIEEWRQSTQGLTSTEVSWQLAVPELFGLAPHNVVGGRSVGPGGVTETRAVQERVEHVAARAAAFANLRETRADSRRVAVMYWNYPPGRQNIGASYLNVVRSIPEILRRMQSEGYVTGDLPDDETISQEIIHKGRNVGRWAPGELEALLADDSSVTVPLSTYRRWYDKLPRAFRADVNAHWGEPEAADIMTTDVDGELHFILPALRFENVVVLPQPDRARTQDLAALYHSQELPPHHQYIAAYLWLQHGFRVDALVHTGTHGTHEWLSGKESGLSGSDPGEVLAGHLPIMYPYIVDDIGEGIVAKRRGAATIVDHLTPALGYGGLSPELEELCTKLLEWRAATGTNPDFAATIATDIQDEVVRRGLHVDLRDYGWSAAKATGPDLSNRMATLEDYMEEIRMQSIPFGLHTFGVSPSGERLDAFVELMADAHDAERAPEFERRLAQSGESELERLMHGLAGGYIPAGPGNDPVRNPDAVPTGKNFFSFDPREVPSPTAVTVGSRLAGELAERHHAEHAEHLQKTAIQVWGVETIRHSGVQEAQALALMGVRVLRDEGTGRVTGVELIPRDELGRPRVDVVVHATSLYRDTFPMLIDLLDEAVQLAAESPEPDNALRNSVIKLKARLIEQGMDPVEAARRARVRIFCEPTGHHDSKIAWMASASGSWETEAQFADNYIRRMGHGYGGGIWGEPMEEEFRAALSGTQAIVHSRTSRLYATLDNDDYFSYGGSIAIGVRRVDGGISPPFYVSDLRTPGQERHETLERFMGQELRARYLNPAYVEGMMEEGYAGGRHIWQSTEYLWGWQVVYPEVVDSAKWTEMYEVWLQDRFELGVTEWFSETNPHARQGMASRMLEAVRKGYWDAPQEIRDSLAEIYVTEVATHGVACDTLTCDNPMLQLFVREIAEQAEGVAPSDIAEWINHVETATQTTVEDAAEQRRRDLEFWHGPLPQQDTAPGPAPVEGYVMEEETTVHHADHLTMHAHDHRHLQGWAALAAALLAFMAGAATRVITTKRA